MADGTERLAKRVAVQQSCSRADAERYIEGGWIAVDGQVVEARFPGRREPDRQPVARRAPGTLRPVTILVHKPVGVYANDEPGSARDLIVPANRMEGDRSPQRYLKRLLAGLRLVTPLERAASGLVVYTQEYPVARKLQEEARLVEQEYIAEVSGSLDAEGLAWLRRGLPYDGLPASPMQVSWQNETRLRFALKTPAPGFIEYACDAAGLELRALRRIRIGRLPLAGAARRPMARAPGLRSASGADAIRRAADILKEHARPMPHDSIPPARRGFLKQAGMLGLAALTLGGCATRRTVAPRSSGGAQAAMPAQGAPDAAAAARRPRGHRRARVGRAERRGRCRRLAAVARLSTAHHAGRPQPPGHAFRLSGPARTRSARPTCTRPSLPPISMPSGACRAVSAPGACWTCWTTNCCAAA